MVLGGEDSHTTEKEIGMDESSHMVQEEAKCLPNEHTKLPCVHS